jgi:hypothetical protein
MPRIDALLLLLLTLATLPVRGQPATDEAPALDEITRTDGTRVAGLILAEEEQGIRLLVVIRRAHQRTLTAEAFVERREIARIERIAAASRAQQLAALEAIRAAEHTARVVARSITVSRQTSSLDGRTPVWVANTERFHFESSAPEEFSRLAAAQLQRLFNACERSFPPRREAGTPVKIHLFGTMTDYRAALGIDVANAAVYLPQRHLVLAGSDLDAAHAANTRTRADVARLEVEVNERREQAAAIERDVKQQRDAALAQLAELQRTRQITSTDAARERERIASWSREQQQRINAYRQQLKEHELQATHARVAHERQLLSYSERLLRTLFHEAFHAYLQQQLFATELTEHVPRWLNEGLAQLYEHAIFEGDELRIGLPDKARLRWLQQRCTAGTALTLEQLLITTQQDFVIHGERLSERAQLCYLQSWALVYHLVQRHGSNPSNPFEPLVAKLAAGEAALAALLDFAGCDAATLEQQWQTTLTELAR